MTAPVITTDNYPIVGAYGDAYSAPSGTPAPTDLAAIGAAWTKLGLISEDGATWQLPTEETTDIKAWQSPFPVRKVTTSLDTSVSFALMEWDRISLPFALGGGTFSENGEVVTFHPPGAGEAESKALFVLVKDGPILFGIYFPNGRITSRDDANFQPDEPALLSVTFGIEVKDTSADPYQLVFGKDTFPPEPEPPITATGATAGTPGTFTPSGAVAPANLAAMSGVVATPATAWTTGQHVVLGDTSHCYWDSAAWTVGDAP